MKTWMTTLALVAGSMAAPALQAQDADGDDKARKTPEERAKHRTEVMAKELKLDEAQAAQVGTINLNYARTLEDVRRIEDPATRKGRMDALKTKRDAALKAALTPEQYNTMITLQEKKKETLKQQRKEDLKGKRGEKQKKHNE